MPKPTTRQELMDEIDKERHTLEQYLATLTDEQMLEPDVVGPWSVKDVLAHLAEWEQMLIGWYRAGKRGETPQLPAEGYNWRQIPVLNEAIYEKYRDWSLEAVRAFYTESHQQTLAMLGELSDDEIFTPKVYAWTRENAILSYIIPGTSGHFRWAKREIRKGLRAKDMA